MKVADEKILVMADDFTGANDAGVSFAEAGAVVDVVFNSAWEGAAQVVVLNSDSRAQSAEQAGASVSELVQKVSHAFRAGWIIKKIDSTLRGNIGAELAAMMAATGLRSAVIAPAFPAAGRTLRGGRCYVDEVPLLGTEFASDPKTPVLSSDLAAIIDMQSAIRCVITTPAQLSAMLRRSAEAEPCAFIVDAQTDEDLDAIAQAAADVRIRPLLVGSAGLCDALARKLFPAFPISHSLLAVVGSMSDTTQRQVALLEGHPRVCTVAIDLQDVFSGNRQPYLQKLQQSLCAGCHCVVHTAPTLAAREQIDALCAVQGLSRSQLGDLICSFLAALTRDAIGETPPAALYLSGGDVAMAVAHALGANGFRLSRRVAGCVPYGKFLGGCWQRPVMTKAGGFGDDATLLQVLKFIEEKMSD